jgi:hypothetical protein
VNEPLFFQIAMDHKKSHKDVKQQQLKQQQLKQQQLKQQQLMQQQYSKAGVTGIPR